MSLLNSLGALEVDGIIRVAQIEPDLEYLFHHAMLQDAAYSTLLESDRKKLHLMVGEAVEYLYPNRLEELAGTLAQHFQKAGEDERALRYFIQAGNAALASFANPEAEIQYRQALELSCSDTQKSELLSNLGEALYRQGRFEEAEKVIRESITICRASADTDKVARLFARIGRVRWHAGDLPGGLKACQEGLDAVGDAPESRGLAILVHETGRAYFFNGMSEQALPLCRKALAIAERLGASDVQADALATLGVLPNLSLEERHQALQQAVDLADAQGLLEIAVRAHHNLAGSIKEYKGDLPSALLHYLQAAELGRKRGVVSEELLSLLGATGVSFNLGDIAEVEKTLAYLDQLANAMANPGVYKISINGMKASYKWLVGEWDEAINLLRACLNDSLQRGDLQGASNSANELAWSLLELQRWDELSDWSEVESALALSKEMVDKGFSDKTFHYSLKSILRVRQGRIAEAEQELAHAYSAIDKEHSIFWQRLGLNLAEAELGVAQKRWVDALSALETITDIETQQGDRWGRARGLLGSAEILYLRGELADLEQARTLLREALAVFDELGSRRYKAVALDRLQIIRERIYAQAVDREKLTQELAQAGRTQEGLLPEKLPVIQGWQLAVILDPARETSGDFYDFIPLQNGKLGILVADVTDKGASAALYMALSRSLIRTYATVYERRPERVIQETNRRILVDTHAGLYVTIFYGVLDPATGEFIYCNAGHNAPYLFRSQNPVTPQSLERTGIPLGIFEDAAWGQGVIQITAGDTLILFTDGLTDAQNDQETFYGEERLVESVHACLDRHAQGIRDGILANVQKFVGKAPQFDDITLMVIRRE